MKMITRDEAAGLMEAATPGPWEWRSFARNACDALVSPEAFDVTPMAGVVLDLGDAEPYEERAGDCDKPGDRALIAAAPGLAHTVVALHDRIAELEATLAAERGDPAGALEGWRWDGSSWYRIADNGDRLRVQRVAILGCPVLWSWVIGRQGHGVIAGDANDPDAWVHTAREAMRAADAAVEAPRG